MQAIQIHAFGDPDALSMEEIEMPSPGRGELLVHVRAAGVNPVDWKIRSGQSRGMIDPPMPITPGTEIAGTIEAVGEDVDGWAEGDAIMALIGLWGGYAEYVVIPAPLAVPKPTNIDFAQAASAPLSLLTAWGALADVKFGQRIMILGAAGGVGTAAIQIAKLKGAEVIGTCSSSNIAKILALGADQAVAYDAPESDTVTELDIVLDLAGVPATSALEVLKCDGTLITVVNPANSVAAIEAGRRGAFFGIVPDRTQLPFLTEYFEKQGYGSFSGMAPDGSALAQVVAHVADGSIRLADPIRFPLDQAANAHRLSETSHAPARIALIMPGVEIN